MTSNTIKFILGEKIHVVDNPDPNETILNYIRLKLKKTGTKEGCAEGGCGACTVVLGELNNNNIIYKAINSCIAFVPSLEGKQLLVVEDLVSNNGNLHAVQDAMVNYHGSQCGFCTPGFVMSLFAMYKNYSSYKEDIIKDSIQGNLCRCTGYRPIIDAAKSLNKASRFDHFSKNKKITLIVNDLGYSVVEKFAKIFPKQFYNAGVAEQNMMGIAAGMALEGRHVLLFNRNFQHLDVLSKLEMM